MKNLTKKLAIVFGILLSASAYGQSNSDWSKFTEDWWMLKGISRPGVKEFKGYVKIVIEPQDTSTYIYTISREKKKWLYDSIWTPTYYNNDDPAMVFAPADKWAVGTGQSKFLNNDFNYRKGTGSPRTMLFSITTTTLSRIRFFSEHFAGHGKYTISVDGGTPVTINAGDTSGNRDGLTTDKDLNKPSFVSKVLPPGTHTLLLSTDAQMVVDFISVDTLTTKIKG